MIGTRALVMAATLVAAAAVGAFASAHHRGAAFRQGISASDAVAAARAFTPDARHATLVWTRSGRVRDFENAGSSVPGHDDDPVWAVQFRGTFRVPSCGPARLTPVPDACPAPAPTMLVLVGYRDGRPLYAQTPGG